MDTEPLGNPTTISVLNDEGLARHREQLGKLLRLCVHRGASIGFVLPFTEEDAEAFWDGSVLPGIRRGRLTMLVAKRECRLAGTVLLDHDTPPNQPHRAEVRKLLVHPDYRRQGVARALMNDLEARARRAGRTLLTLDTRTGDTAEPLYTALGFRIAGVVPGYCRDPFEDRLDSTTLMYKTLEEG